MEQNGIWTPDLASIGVEQTALPEGWGWTTLNRNEEVVFGTPLTRKPGYGEFTVTPVVTERNACNHIFEVTRLVIATTSGDNRQDERFFLRGEDWYHGLTPWAEAPHWWLFGPQGQEFFAFVDRCAQLGDRLWRGLDSFSVTFSRSTATARLRCGPEQEVLSEVDKIMSAARRRGAVGRAIHRATEKFYTYHVDRYDSYRFVTSEGLALCQGSALYGVDRYSREAVGAVDNIVRWLILRDILPTEIYRWLADPWLDLFGWPLHPEDA